MRCSSSSRQRPRPPLGEVSVRVTPRASHERIEAGDPAKVYVTVPPVDGGANKAVCDAVAKALGVAKGRVSVARGHKSRDKVLAVEDMETDEIARRLAGG